MRRFLLSCTILAVLAVPAAAAGRASAPVKTGFLVVRRAVGDGGVKGRPVATVVMQQGFVLGRVSQEAEVDIYHLRSASDQNAPQVNGSDVSGARIRWHGLSGRKYSGSNFRFRAVGGFYRVVVRGSGGVYIFAGGRGTVWLQGSSVNRQSDGEYSIDGRRFRSMPTRVLQRQIGRG